MITLRALSRVPVALPIALFAALAPPPRALAAGCVDYGSITHWVNETPIAGNVQDFEVSRGYLFATVLEGYPEVSKLLAFDLGDPEAPVEIAGIELVGYVDGLALDGNYAYVANSLTLDVVDVSDPPDLHVVSGLPIPDYARDVVVRDGIAYVAGNALTIVDVSDPGAPAILGTESTPILFRLAIDGDLAFLAAGYAGLVLVDVSDPHAPVTVGQLVTPDYAEDVTLHAGYVYVADRFSGLQVVDASVPSSPTVVHQVPGPGGVVSTFDFVVAGDYGYVPGIWALDVRDPAAPSVLGTFDAGGREAVRSGDYLYFGGAVIDVARIADGNPADPLLAALDTPGEADDVFLAGDLAYVVDSRGGSQPTPSVQIVDLADPAAPSFLGHFDTPGHAYAVSVSGPQAYVIGQEGFHVVDVTDPTAAAIVGELEFAAIPADFEVEGALVYLLMRDGELALVDVSNPTDPTVVGGLDVGIPNHHGLARWQHFAYLFSYYDGLTVVDVSDPQDLRIVGTNPELDRGSAGFVARDGYLYITSFLNELLVVDLAVPEAPALVRRVGLSNRGEKISFHGSLAYVTSHFGGMHVVDCSDPPAARLIGGIDTPGRAYAVAASEEYVVVGDGLEGIRVFRPQCGAASSSAPAAGSAVGAGFAYPNPFARATTFLLEGRGGADAEVSVFDVAGRRVWQARRQAGAGPREIRWDGRDAQGRAVPGGVYFYDLRVGPSTSRGKLVRLR